MALAGVTTQRKDDFPWAGEPRKQTSQQVNSNALVFQVTTKGRAGSTGCRRLQVNAPAFPLDRTTNSASLEGIGATGQGCSVSTPDSEGVQNLVLISSLTYTEPQRISRTRFLRLFCRFTNYSFAA